MSNKIKYSIGMVVVVLVIVLLWVAQPSGKKEGENGIENVGATTTEQSFYGVNKSDAYSTAVPENAVLSPASVAPAAANNANAKEQLRTIEVKISSKGFEPSTVIVNQGDVVRLQMTATDGDYDVSIPYTGNYQSMKKGETKPIAFGATAPGTLAFLCMDMCPAGGVIKGSIVILPQ
jgi:plastocyanin